MSEPFDLGTVLEIFSAEAAEQLALMEESVLALEGRPDEPELLATVFRVVHTLKGNAASLGFRSIADLAHALEDLLDRLREGTAHLSPGLAVFLLRDRRRPVPSRLGARRLRQPGRRSGGRPRVPRWAARPAPGPS